MQSGGHRCFAFLSLSHAGISSPLTTNHSPRSSFAAQFDPEVFPLVSTFAFPDIGKTSCAEVLIIDRCDGQAPQW